MRRSLLLVVSCCAVFTVFATDEAACRAATTCGDCIALEHSACAWCSGRLRWLNGTWAPDTQRCVRLVDYGNELLCFNVLSVGECQVGYQCDASLGQCVVADEAGTGDTLDHCQGTCNCTSAGCGRFSCFGGVNDLFTCGFNPTGNETTTLSKCADTCGISSATPIPAGPGGCTPPCTVPCHPDRADCCGNATCGFDFVWNDYRCHVPGRMC